jgi:putative SOS response-associated peptidase YedK
VTTAAVDDLALIHDRMPLVLPPSRWDAWLEGPPDASLLASPTSSDVAGLELRPVGAAVGDVHNDGPELIRRVAAPSLTESGENPVDLTLF